MRETKWWAWHMIAGIVIFVLLGLHMLITHFDDILGWFNVLGPSHAIEWQNVVARAQSIFFAATYIILLIAALFHGLYGARTIICEMNIGVGVRKFVDVLFWLVGLSLLIVGTWAAIASMAIKV